MQIGQTLEKKIDEIIEPSLQLLGYAVVRVKIIGDDERKILQIMLEKSDGGLVNIDDCQKASRQISAVLDVEDVITSKYFLEVSSPGLDRPLTRLRDFENHKGKEAKIETIEKIGESRKFRGRLAGVDGNDVLLSDNVVEIGADSEVIKISIDNIKSAKLVLTDELLGINKTKKTNKKRN